MGLGNDVGHLVELVMDLNKSLQNVSARLGTLETCIQTTTTDMTMLVTGVAEGVGTLGRDFTSMGHDLGHVLSQQDDLKSAVHELGSISLRNFFNLPVTSGKQIRCSFCNMSGKYLTLILSKLFFANLHPCVSYFHNHPFWVFLSVK